MSRSWKKSPVHGITCAESEKSDKKRWHRAYRRAAKQAIESDPPLHHREFSDPWSMAKDGKRYDGELRREWLRK